MNRATLELALYKEEEEHARCRRDLRESEARCEQAIDALRIERDEAVHKGNEAVVRRIGAALLSLGEQP